MNADYEAFLKLCSQCQLQALLEDIEQRLGTPAELPDDVPRAIAVAHQLNNVLTRGSLLEAVRRIPGARARGPRP
jgi:hypothetical protein